MGTYEQNDAPETTVGHDDPSESEDETPQIPDDAVDTVFPETPPESQTKPLEFKMPESFDLSHGYIQQIVPFNANIKTVGYKTDDLSPTESLVQKELFPVTDIATDALQHVQQVLDECFVEIDNEPVQDNLEAITYTKDQSSKSRSRDVTGVSKRNSKKKDRKQRQDLLFGREDSREALVKEEKKMSADTIEKVSSRKGRDQKKVKTEKEVIKSEQRPPKQTIDTEPKVKTGSPNHPICETSR